MLLSKDRISKLAMSCESTSAGEPHWPSPAKAVNRAINVETFSGEGRARSSNENCWVRAGTGSTTTVTWSIPADGRCDSRSSRTSVRSTRGSRSGVGSCNVRV